IDETAPPMNRPALTIRMHPDDNVAIVANDGGLPAGTVLPPGVPGAGITLRDKVPQGHKEALQDMAEGAVVRRIKDELLPLYPHVDDVIGLEHTYGCGVAIDAPDAIIPICTLRNISLNPNFGGEVMVVSLGCEKLQPDRLLPPGSFPITDERDAAMGPETVCLQADEHVMGKLPG